MNYTHRRQLFWNSLVIVFGNALYALAVALFLEPAGLVTGGATGIALAFGRLTGLSVSGFLLVFNLAMLVWGWAVLGRAFALNTLASSILSPVFWRCGSGFWPTASSPKTSSCARSSRGWASAWHWGWSSGPVPPPAAWISRRWCFRNGSACRCLSR